MRVFLWFLKGVLRWCHLAENNSNFATDINRNLVVNICIYVFKNKNPSNVILLCTSKF
jgi:hypothetical protein